MTKQFQYEVILISRSVQYQVLLIILSCIKLHQQNQKEQFCLQYDKKSSMWSYSYLLSRPCIIISKVIKNNISDLSNPECGTPIFSLQYDICKILGHTANNSVA